MLLLHCCPGGGIICVYRISCAQNRKTTKTSIADIVTGIVKAYVPYPGETLICAVLSIQDCLHLNQTISQYYRRTDGNTNTSLFFNIFLETTILQQRKLKLLSESEKATFIFNNISLEVFKQRFNIRFYFYFE